MQKEIELFKQSYELAQYAFQFEDDEKHQKRFDYLLRHSDLYASYDGDELASQIIATPFKVHFFDKLFDMVGVGFVSSNPAYRGEGRIDQLMVKLLADCREKKVLFSYLAPFSYPFYRRYGYELLFERLTYQVTSQDWPDSPKITSGSVRKSDWEVAKKAIQEIYCKVSEAKSGVIDREEWWYEYKYQLPQQYTYAVYYNAEQQPEGYLVYKLSEGIFTCVEWEYTTATGYHSLNRYIASHKDSTREIHYQKGYDKKTNFYLQSRPIAKASIQPEMMVRIIDVAQFLNEFPFSGLNKDFALVIEEDEYAPWNTGVYEVTATNNQVRNVDDSSLPKLTTSIQRMTQLFLGYKTLEDLVFHELIEVDSEIFESIAAVLPKVAPTLEDYF